MIDGIYTALYVCKVSRTVGLTVWGRATRPSVERKLDNCQLIRLD
jgi:hypothetical protein